MKKNVGRGAAVKKRRRRVKPWQVVALCLAAAILLALSGWLVKAVEDRTSRFDALYLLPEVPALMGLSAESVFNTGDPKRLDAFPGVGEVISQRIVETRESLGGFVFLEDLMLVKGIGEKTFEKIMGVFGEGLVTVWTTGE